MRIVFTYKQLEQRIRQGSFWGWISLFVFWCLTLLFLGFMGYLCVISDKGNLIDKYAGVAQVVVINQRGPSTSGTAFLIASRKGQGYALTAAHVVKDVKRVKLIFPKAKYETEASVLYVAATGDQITGDRDFALLQVLGDVRKITPLVLGDSDRVQEQDRVLVLGYPLGKGELHHTEGIISNKAPNNLRTTAQSNPGNSGGPLLDKKQNIVLGIMHSSIAIKMPDGSTRYPEGMHNAVPINIVKKVLNQSNYPLE